MVKFKIKQQESIGLPFKRQLFGFCKADVIAYIQSLVDDMARDRAELAAEKALLYELMEKGQRFCDDIAVHSKQEAAEVIARAQASADKLEADAMLAVKMLRRERQQLSLQYRDEVHTLSAGIAANRKETDEAYQRMLQPVEAMLLFLEEKQDAP